MLKVLFLGGFGLLLVFLGILKFFIGGGVVVGDGV